MTKVLNVAEKPDAAKRISALLSNNGANRREGRSKYNKIFDFSVNIPGYGNCQMSMTSVSGHLKGVDFTDSHRKWNSCNQSCYELFSNLNCYGIGNFLLLNK